MSKKSVNSKNHKRGAKKRAAEEKIKKYLDIGSRSVPGPQRIVGSVYTEFRRTHRIAQQVARYQYAGIGIVKLNAKISIAKKFSHNCAGEEFVSKRNEKDNENYLTLAKRMDWTTNITT